MSHDFPPAPSFEGLTYLGTQPIFVKDEEAGCRVVFPIHHYRDDATGERFMASDEQYAKYHHMVAAWIKGTGGEA